MAILKRKVDAATKVFGLRIPAALHAEYEETRRAADTAGLVLSVNALLTESLARIVRQAQTELRQMQQPRIDDGGGEA